MEYLANNLLNPALLEMETSTMVAIFLPIFAALLITVFIPLIRKRQQEEEAGGKDD